MNAAWPAAGHTVLGTLATAPRTTSVLDVAVEEEEGSNR
jgi:hypothetical protein